ncbi:MAG: hypothetical protein ACYTFG_22605, partial [Planctomycetota bacterium]
MSHETTAPPEGESRERSKEAWISGGVLLGAMCIRLIVWSVWKHDPLYGQPVLDAAFYRDLASGTVELPSGPFLWNPLYPAFLKTLLRAGGELPGSAVFVQMGLGAVG